MYIRRRKIICFLIRANHHVMSQDNQTPKQSTELYKNHAQSGLELQTSGTGINALNILANPAVDVLMIFF